MLAALFYMKSRTSEESGCKKKYRLRSMKLLTVYLSISVEPCNPIPKPIDNKRNIMSFSDSDCKTFFGFNSQADLYRLMKCLRLDQDLITLSNRSIMSGEEVMLRGLYELVTGEFQSSVAVNVFGRELSQQSRAFTYFISHIYRRFCHLLLDNLEWFRDTGLLEESRRAIRKKLLDLGYIFDEGEKHTIGLFIDCNCLETCRPGGGPLTGGHDGLRYDSLVQQTFYNGWKSQHGLKHQTIDTAHGITCHLFGPFSLRHNDLLLLGESDILDKFGDLFEGIRQKITIFGDSAYPTSDILRSYVLPEIATRHQKDHNRRLKSVRESIEHNYALTKNLYKYLSRVEKLKILNNPTVLRVYTVCTFLKNCHVMMYGCESSQYFNILLDTENLLERYTQLQITDTQVAPMIGFPLADPLPAIVENTDMVNRTHLERNCNRPQNIVPEVARDYIVTNRISLPGIQLGLSQSDIPNAGLGVFLLDDYPEGTRLAKYGGKLLRNADLLIPGYDTSYVWSDINKSAELARRGLRPLIIDANPIYAPSYWGGMINDGLHRGANVTLKRYKNQVYVVLLENGVSGMELYLEYGIDYWQERFQQVTQNMQEELVAHYGLRVIPVDVC